MNWVIVFFLQYGPWEVPYNQFETKEQCEIIARTMTTNRANWELDRYPKDRTILLTDYNRWMCVPKSSHQG